MLDKKHSATVTLVILLAVSLLAVNPAMGQQLDSSSGADNIVCDADSGGQNNQTSLGSLIASVVSLIVTVAALIAVVGGAGFTLASAAKPTADYAERRNQTIIYGGGTVLVLYGANALITQIDQSLSFSCILPFT